MSLHDRATAAVIAQLAMAADGALFGLGVAYVAYRSIRKYTATSSALRKIRDAPSVQPSDLRSIIPDDNDPDSSHPDDGNASNSSFEGGKLLIVRGCVEAKSAAEKGNLKSLRGDSVVVSQETGEKGVILQRTQTCIYNEWRGVFGWTADLRSMLSRSWKEQESSSIRTVPFILVEAGKWPQSDYVVVNMDGSGHPLPLTTVYQHLQPINASPYIFLQALFGLEYPVGLLYEEKILPLGKDITAVGICNLKNGIPEIKSCKDLPYFLSDLTKDQMLADLSFKTKVLMWSGLIFSSIAIGIIGYSITRNWVRWKEWRRQRRDQQQNNSTNSQTPAEVAADEDSGDVPEGELCVICLMRRRRSAFIPCGHLVCCQRCALSVEREVSPKCPVCRQPIRSSVRIYDS
ncbi:putative E3 ubiquitin ligase [Handroanthus impetiginosus]|uniref:RING-type E3 ubiquitin transferase n=1 Tax=Handroanthus impetiginosus TaxID=429701 RepID=A0A2G9HXR3_9LAMI|nr:putative E3 ubiquitin ligase [Handroanthus impetiginosus]